MGFWFYKAMLIHSLLAQLESGGSEFIDVCCRISMRTLKQQATKSLKQRQKCKNNVEMVSTYKFMIVSNQLYRALRC